MKNHVVLETRLFPCNIKIWFMWHRSVGIFKLISILTSNNLTNTLLARMVSDSTEYTFEIVSRARLYLSIHITSASSKISIIAVFISCCSKSRFVVHYFSKLTKSLLQIQSLTVGYSEIMIINVAASRAVIRRFADLHIVGWVPSCTLSDVHIAGKQLPWSTSFTRVVYIVHQAVLNSIILSAIILFIEVFSLSSLCLLSSPPLISAVIISWISIVKIFLILAVTIVSWTTVSPPCFSWSKVSCTENPEQKKCWCLHDVLRLV